MDLINQKAQSQDDHVAVIEDQEQNKQPPFDKKRNISFDSY